MLTFRNKYARNVYSQNGEDGILEEIFTRIGGEGIAVEFGAADGFWCSNIRNLMQKHAWDGYQFDIETTNPFVKKIAITEQNVNEELPEKCDLLSIDIDGNDFNVWRAYKGRAEVVVIEINSDIPPDAKVYDRGTSYFPMVLLGISKGYTLLCHTGNLIFIRNEHKHLFPEIEGNPLKDFDLYFDKSWIK